MPASEYFHFRICAMDQSRPVDSATQHSNKTGHRFVVYDSDNVSQRFGYGKLHNFKTTTCISVRFFLANCERITTIDVLSMQFDTRA